MSQQARRSPQARGHTEIPHHKSAPTLAELEASPKIIPPVTYPQSRLDQEPKALAVRARKEGRAREIGGNLEWTLMYTFSAAFSSSLRTLPPEDRSLRCRYLAAALVAIAADRETLEDDDVTRSLALRCAPLADLPSLEERNELLEAASGPPGPRTLELE